MKNITFTILYVFLSIFAVQGQLVLHNDRGDEITNETVDVHGFSDEIYVQYKVFFTNTGEEEVAVSVRKIEVDMVEGSDNTFCWNGQCYTPTVFDSNDVADPIVLASQESSTESCFYTDFYPGGEEGLSKIRYEFYDPDGSFETVSVDFNFEITSAATHVEGFSGTIAQLSDASPNPARGHTWINYELPYGTQSAKIVVRNLLGNAVISENLNIDENRMRIDTKSLSNGIYIYSLIVNNQTVQSKRLVIAN